MNFVKLFLMIALCATLLIGGGIYLSAEAMLFGVMISLSLLIGIFWLSDKIVLKMCDAELLTPHHSPPLFRAVEEISQKARMHMPKIYMIPGESPNAFSVGKGRKSAAIAFTEGIVKGLTPDELRCVIAHEVFRIKNRDAMIGSLAATLAGISGMGIGRYASAKMMAEDDSRFRRIGKRAAITIKSIFAQLAALIIQSLVNVSRVYRTDERAARLCGAPLSMASAIRTMEKQKHKAPLITSPAAAHLFTISPLTIGRTATLFNTHPPMEDRIARLDMMARRDGTAQQIQSGKLERNDAVRK